jgi:hypothetical protein
MSVRRRRLVRGVPDNLGPLVDTLSNVVGILIMVIVVTRLELGEALDRVISIQAAGQADRASHAEKRAEIEARTRALQERTDSAPGEALALAEELRAAVASIPLEVVKEQDALEDTAVRSLVESLEDERAALEAERRNLIARMEHADGLKTVPARLVARLPDPQLERGYVSWILIRQGRVFAVDREALYEAGSRALQRVLGPAIARGVRRDEFESAALYLRKHRVGSDGFSWRLRNEDRPRMELEWPSMDQGRMPDQLARDVGWQDWLARRNPEQDFVLFHVWSDSFEAYAAARQAVETAGLRAGWVGHERDEELELNVQFGPRPSREQTIEVD